MPEWAGGLLLQTRLLLDSPVADDPEMQELLEELELVLAQIVSLSPATTAPATWPGSIQGLEER